MLRTSSLTCFTLVFSYDGIFLLSRNSAQNGCEQFPYEYHPPSFPPFSLRCPQVLSMATSHMLFFPSIYSSQPWSPAIAEALPMPSTRSTFCRRIYSYSYEDGICMRHDDIRELYHVQDLEYHTKESRVELTKDISFLSHAHLGV